MIRLVADVSLFDQTMYGYQRGDLAWAMVGTVAGRGVDERMEMGLKWMIERNERDMEWLQKNGIRRAGK